MYLMYIVEIPQVECDAVSVPLYDVTLAASQHCNCKRALVFSCQTLQTHIQPLHQLKCCLDLGINTANEYVLFLFRQ